MRPSYPLDPFCPLGRSPQAKLSALSFSRLARKKSEKILLKLIFFVLLHQLEKSELKNAEEE